jgi:hypothetical protein
MLMNATLKALLALSLIPTLAAGIALADQPKVTVYKSPTCGCCTKWITHMQHNGFEVEAVDMKDMRMIKSMSGVNPQLSSCHTAKVGGYVIEGHVPAEDVKRLLAEHPADVKGLTAPGMPQSSPGMDIGHVPYQVLSFDESGHTQVYAQH